MDSKSSTPAAPFGGARMIALAALIAAILARSLYASAPATLGEMLVHAGLFAGGALLSAWGRSDVEHRALGLGIIAALAAIARAQNGGDSLIAFAFAVLGVALGLVLARILSRTL